MKPITEVNKELANISSRHGTFKDIFNTFQGHITNLTSDSFPVKGICVSNVSYTQTTISFIGRTYEINFSICMVNNSPKGKISISRIYSDGNSTEISSVTYNGQSIADIQPPKGGDQVSLSEDICCMNLVVNWLLAEINT
jgi:hypothetical protein